MPLTPAQLSGSQLTHQLRLYAEDIVDLDDLARAHAEAIYSVMLAAAEYIDHLQGRVVAMEERAPAHYIFTSGGVETPATTP